MIVYSLKGGHQLLNYIHNIPTRIYFGKGQISHLAEALAPFGRKVLLTYGGGSIKKIGLYDEVMRILLKEGFTVTELSGIEPNPRIESVEKGVRLCRENHIDVILAVGGGSTIDCSKAIAAGVFYEGNDLWEMVRTASVTRRALPLVDILTLSATGSEFDGGGVITNLKTNEKLGGMYTYPAASICDPTYNIYLLRLPLPDGGGLCRHHEPYFRGLFFQNQRQRAFRRYRGNHPPHGHEVLSHRHL